MNLPNTGSYQIKKACLYQYWQILGLWTPRVFHFEMYRPCFSHVSFSPNPPPQSASKKKKKKKQSALILQQSNTYHTA